MNKKSIELAMNTIVIATIVLIVALIIIFMFRHYYGKETEIVGIQIDLLKDYDGDGFYTFDKCPCKPGEFGGCPTEKPTEEDMKYRGLPCPQK